MIIQNISTKLNNNTRHYKSHSILLYFIFLIIMLLQPLNAQTLKFPSNYGRRENTDFGARSLFTHLETEKGLQFGVSIFFFTGKVIGIKASGLYIVVADIQKKEYQKFSKIQVSLFSSTTHTVDQLMENYSDNVLERYPKNGLYKVKVEMDDFSISLKFNPLKKPIDIGELAVSDESFNRAYAIPRGKISAQMLYEGEDYKFDGIGIFQHQ